MRRRRLAFLVLAATVTTITACDTDDGREMQTPDSFARFRLENTTTSTSTTIVPPTEFIPATTSTTTSSTSTSTSSTSTSSTSTSSPTVSTSQPGATTNPGSAAVNAVVQFAGPWTDGAAIPGEYTCDGAGIAPLLTWAAPDPGTAELALTVTDPDAGGFVHWIVIGLPVGAGSVGGGEALVTGAAEGINSFDGPGWAGPCPPPGDAAHTYVFTLHLLDQAMELPADSATADLIAAVEAATADQATFSGTYERA